MSRAHPNALAQAVVSLSLTALFLPAMVSAQTPAEIDATAQRLSQEVPCVRTQNERLASTLRLLEEAERQARSASGNAARRDAVHSAEALELRLGVIVGELRACLVSGASQGASGAASTHTGTLSATGATATGSGTGYVPPPPHVVVRHDGDGTPHPAESPNPATEVLDSGRALPGQLYLVQAERVDGLGRADNADVRQAVDRVAPHISHCYEQLVSHSAHQRGRVYLTFTVTPEGRVRDIRLENFTIFDRTFQRCVGAAAGHLRVTHPAIGGSARYSFHLRFGPPVDRGTPEVD
ncbi:MAG: AgmX/PglI C-terminal domain-containing protein [Polyangiales bacterium]